MEAYIHQRSGWPNFKFDARLLLELIGNIQHERGRFLGQLAMMPVNLRKQIIFDTAIREITASLAIEGEELPTEQLRKEMAFRLSGELVGQKQQKGRVQSIVSLYSEAVKLKGEVNAKSLLQWQSMLYPESMLGRYKVLTGSWRNDADGPLQIVSGGLGYERLHFIAPAAHRLEKEMKQFAQWLAAPFHSDVLIKVALAHLYFLTIHPFEDGNGPIARLLSGSLLAKADREEALFYAPSESLWMDKTGYFTALELAQKGEMDVTEWVVWYLKNLQQCYTGANDALKNSFRAYRFWQEHTETAFNERQRKILNQLLAGTLVKISNAAYAKSFGCSADSALRDMTELVQLGILQRLPGGGRSTAYQLKMT
jgi:Fic family protein